MQKIPGGHFYGQFWQAFPKGFRRPKATTFKNIPSSDGALHVVVVVIYIIYMYIFDLKEIHTVDSFLLWLGYARTECLSRVRPCMWVATPAAATIQI